MSIEEALSLAGMKRKRPRASEGTRGSRKELVRSCPGLQRPWSHPCPEDSGQEPTPMNMGWCCATEILCGPHNIIFNILVATLKKKKGNR